MSATASRGPLPQPPSELIGSPHLLAPKLIAVVVSAAMVTGFLAHMSMHHDVPQWFVGAGLLSFLLLPILLLPLVRPMTRSVTAPRRADRKQRLAAFLNHAPTVVVVVDRKRCVVRANRAAEQFTRRRPEEMMGLRVGEVLRCASALATPRGCGLGPQCDRCVLQMCVLDTFGSGDPHHREEWGLRSVRHGEESEGHLLVSTHVTCVAGRDLVIVHLEDITPLRRTEDALRRARGFSESLIRSSVDGIFAFDRECRCTAWNPAMARISGLREEETVGRVAFDVFPLLRETGDDEILLEVLAGRRCVAKARSFGVSTTGERRLFEGHYSPLLSEEREVVGGLAIIRDVTERRRAERALESIFLGTASETGEGFFRSLVRHLATTLGVRCALIGEIREDERVHVLAIWADGGFADCFEYPLAGTPCGSVIVDGTRRFPRGVRSQFPQCRLLAKMGLESYLGTPLRDASGVPLGVLAVMDDRPMGETPMEGHLLTIFAARAGAELGRERAEREQAKLAEHLRQMQKMEAVGRLVSGVAHDFNNLLSGILGYTEFAMQGFEPDDPRLNDLTQVREAGQRAAVLVRQLLAFGRRQVLQRQDINLNDLVVNLMQMLRRLIGESITLDVVLDPVLGTVRVDPAQIEQVLMNLLINARDAMPDGGRIVVATENVMLDCNGRGNHSSVKRRHALLRISDTGCGMAPETLARIFEPFFTTKQNGKGTGLGLAMVYGTVRQHGGVIRAESDVGTGTTFRVYLPIVDRPATAVDTAVSARIRGGTETILLAEDERVVRELTTRILTGAGYKVVATEDGEEAVQAFERQADEIDLVLLDGVMPRMGGRAAMEKIRAIRPDARFLFSSGYGANATDTGFTLDEGMHLLSKPYSPGALLSKVREVLDS